MTPENFLEWLKNHNYSQSYTNEVYNNLLDLIDYGVEFDYDVIRSRFWHKKARYRRIFTSAYRKYIDYIGWCLNGNSSRYS